MVRKLKLPLYPLLVTAALLVGLCRATLGQGDADLEAPGLPPYSMTLAGGAATLSPVYWAFRGVHRGCTTFPKDFPAHMDYDDSVWIVCVALVAQIVVLLGLTAWFLRRKDVGRA